MKNDRWFLVSDWCGTGYRYGIIKVCTVGNHAVISSSKVKKIKDMKNNESILSE